MLIGSVDVQADLRAKSVTHWPILITCPGNFWLLWVCGAHRGSTVVSRGKHASHIWLRAQETGKLISFHDVELKGVTDHLAYNICIEFHPPFIAYVSVCCTRYYQVGFHLRYCDMCVSVCMFPSSLCVGSFPLHSTYRRHAEAEWMLKVCWGHMTAQCKTTQNWPMVVHIRVILLFLSYGLAWGRIMDH